ncbi:MAG TPA: CBS domain-containing protein [Candidatus Saccharimonadales bacterium]|nr:CBS domain-containing protein [Candidatus Saccharimonadales bacterium]
MFIVMTIACVLLVVLLVLIAGVMPRRPSMSHFELERRRKAGDREAARIFRRETLLAGVVSLQRVVCAMLLVLIVLFSVGAFGWVIGVVISVVIALEYNAFARIGAINRQSQKLYSRIEEPILSLVEKYPKLFNLIRTALPAETEARLESREELLHLVEKAGAVLSQEERKHIVNGLTFGDRRVKEIMTPRGMIDSISKKELLGPLVLDDLHKTGHSRFPVTDGDIDHVVGMLYIQDLLVVDSGKRSGSVEKTMEPRVFYIHEDQSLTHALAAFIRTHHHLFVVINEFRETVGVISLEDVMEALLGHKIIDEFDTHEDLRVVAARNPRKNNHPNKREDV